MKTPRFEELRARFIAQANEDLARGLSSEQPKPSDAGFLAPRDKTGSRDVLPKPTSGGGAKLPPSVSLPGDGHGEDDPWWLAWLLYADSHVNGTKLSDGAPKYDQRTTLDHATLQSEVADDGLDQWFTDGGA
jgi:hypothetical protein